jgi:tetratricopeptide (TPR) repeat protein
MKYHALYILLFSILSANFLTAQDSYSKDFLQKLAQLKPMTPYDSLMVKGALFASSDTVLAAQYFNEALEIAFQENNIDKRAWSNIALGEMYMDKQLLRKAYSYFSRAKTLTNDEKPLEEAALAAFGIARVQFYAGNYRNSVLNFLLTIYLAKQAKNKALEAEATIFKNINKPSAFTATAMS